MIDLKKKATSSPSPIYSTPATPVSTSARISSRSPQKQHTPERQRRTGNVDKADERKKSNHLMVARKISACDEKVVPGINT